MFPNTNYDPAAFPQGAVYAAIPRPVARDLFAPELRVGFWLGGVFRATVPETAVDEDGDVEQGEDEVGADAAGELRTSNAQL